MLLSGDHAAIARWRRAESLRRTADRRPDLLPPCPTTRWPTPTGRCSTAMPDRIAGPPAARVVVLDPAGPGAAVRCAAGRPGDAAGRRPVLVHARRRRRGRASRCATAAVRELAEEIGLVVDPAALEGPVWLRRLVGPLAGRRRSTHRETYFVLRDVVHEVDVSGQTELEAYEDQPHRWWTRRGDRRQRRRRSSPRELADLLPELLDGPVVRGRRASSPEDVAQ